MKSYGMRYLNARDLRALLSMEDAMACVERAYRWHVSGQGVRWPVISQVFEPELRDMDIKSGWVREGEEGFPRGFFGLKVMGYAGDNPVERGLAALAGLVVVMDVETGHPLGLVDGASLTELRTGAAGAVGARLLARPGIRRGLILGTGSQARAQLAGIAAALPHVRDVAVAGRNALAVGRFVGDMAPFFPQISLRPLGWNEVPAAAREAELIVTCTPASTPILWKGWISPGTHVNAIGADMPEKQEVEASLLEEARVFADDRAQAFSRGECHHARDRGFLEEGSVREIGEVLLGRAPGRSSEEEITLFDVTGMALQDLAGASRALARAAELGAGQLLVE
ncbi:MAG TPA: ornithine cyclodeaminase family protein [Synergistaceae bacterium]|nr:ornithine cyclodeaminase family protein [Synergistaceae bacterium]